MQRKDNKDSTIQVRRSRNQNRPQELDKENTGSIDSRESVGENINQVDWER